MDIDPLEKVRVLARGRSLQELLQLRENCLAKQNLVAADVCESELDAHFPNWQTTGAVRARRGGAAPTTAMFRQRIQAFPSQIDGYIWLVNQFAACNLNMFESHGRDDVNYLRLLFGSREGGAMHFAPTQGLLDRKITKDPCSDARPVQLDCGWWINTNLSGLQKLRILERLAHHCGFAVEEWSWVTADETPALHRRVIQRDRGRVLLAELARRK